MKFIITLSALFPLITSALQLAPLVPAERGAKVIPGEWIVQLRTNSAVEQDGEKVVQDHLRRVFGQQFQQQQLLHQYTKTPSFVGYAGTFSEQQVNQIRRDQDTFYVEQNQEMWASDVQKGPYNWGIDRIDQKELPLDELYHYPDNAGEGVDVYVVDTGVMIDHEDFKTNGKSRAFWGHTSPKGEKPEDGNGHGTHVASTAVGTTRGVAKNAHVYAVKVLRSSGYGSNADVIDGVAWVGTAHLAAKKKNKDAKSVANMSLGGGRSNALDNAVEAVIATGIHFAVAAGNENQNACNSSPASAPSAVTVAASTDSDRRAYFSNWGTCVDIFGPGMNIDAAWNDGDYKTISGTSMASPHVAGYLAVEAWRQPASITPAEMTALMLKNAIPDAIANVRGSPNLLVYQSPGEVGTESFDKSKSRPKPSHNEGNNRNDGNQRVNVEAGWSQFVNQWEQRHFD